LGDHQDSRFMPHITKRQLSSEDLDDQHREREDISLFRTGWLSVPLLAGWIDELGS
jgi:hypothetical protein